MISLAKNPYWNTMWSIRDQEFYWSGVKFGALFSAIMIPVTVGAIWGIVNDFKELTKK